MNQVVTESIIKAVVTVGVPILIGAVFRLKLHASKEEQLFTSEPTNILRNFILFIFLIIFFLCYGLFATNMKLNNLSKIYMFFWNLFFNWGTFVFVISVSLLLILVRTILKKITRRLLFKSVSKWRGAILGVLIFVPILLIFMFTFYCGFLVNGLIAESKQIVKQHISDSLLGLRYFYKIETPNMYLILITVFLYAFIVFMLIRFLMFVSKEKITAHIYLKNGTVLNNKFILNYSLDNSILISNWEDRSEGDKILIPKSNIEYIIFERTIYVLDQLSPGSGIVDPRYFDKQEEAKLKEKFLKKISKNF